MIVIIIKNPQFRKSNLDCIRTELIFCLVLACGDISTFIYLNKFIVTYTNICVYLGKMYCLNEDTYSVRNVYTFLRMVGVEKNGQGGELHFMRL